MADAPSAPATTNGASPVAQEQQVEEGIKKSLSLWNIEYFDLYLVHFPLAIEYIDPDVKFPQEWWGLDGKVHPSKWLICTVCDQSSDDICSQGTLPRDMGRG